MNDTCLILIEQYSTHLYFVAIFSLLSVYVHSFQEINVLF